MTFFAHSTNDPTKVDWEPLFTPFGKLDVDNPQAACGGQNGGECEHCENMAPLHGHLNKVAYWTGRFASNMFSNKEDKENAQKWGYVTGLWHDLGKFSEEFQKKLEGERISVEHAGAGAVFAKLQFQEYSSNITHHYPVAACISGHHAGLSNFRDQGEGKCSALLQRIKNNESLDLPIPSLTAKALSKVNIPIYFDWLNTKDKQEFSLPFFTRMLFSCLVDADSVVTEATEKANARDYNYSTISKLSATLDNQLESLSKSEPDPRKNAINHDRDRILKACQGVAKQDNGVFSLNVPTGGGKTLSGMSFALRHAAHCKQERVIVLAPFTTIIEQTAAEYRKFLGEQNIIEHHSNIDDFNESEETDEAKLKLISAAENFDAPVIVTTTVQFFESLFSNKRGRCRKIHNIANSTIIIDEAQCLPTFLLDSTLAALNDLANNYNCSIILSTATQPALEKRRRLPMGFEKITPIIPEELTLELHTKLTKSRIDLTWDLAEAKNTEAASESLRKTDAQQKLIIVNTRREAAEIYEQYSEASDDESIYHLSTNLCPAHRKNKLDEIKLKLKSGKPCTVISTQLIECGIDHSYQSVTRSLAGLDSLAQAAGRNNRHGELKEKGNFTVYRPENQPSGFLGNCASITETVLGKPLPCDLTDLKLFKAYFSSLYQTGGRDTPNVIGAYDERNLEDVASRYKLIEDYKPFSVIIPWGDEGLKRLNKVLKKITFNIPLNKKGLRSLQQYTVNLSMSDYQKIQAYTEPLLDGGYSSYAHPHSLNQVYCDKLGLKLHSNLQPKEGYYV